MEEVTARVEAGEWIRRHAAARPLVDLIRQGPVTPHLYGEWIRAVEDSLQKLIVEAYGAGQALASLAAARAEAERQDALIEALSRAIIADVDEARQGLEGVRAAFLTGKDGTAAADRIFDALSRLRNAVPQEHDWVAKELRAALAGRAESTGGEA